MSRRLFSPLLVLTAACSALGPPPEHEPTQTPVSPIQPTFDTGRPRDPLPGLLPFFYDLYTFRGDSGSTRVVASFAVPARRLAEERDDGEVRYRFDVTLVLADTALGTVFRTDDSVYVSSPTPLHDDHLLYTYIEVPAPPSRTTVHRVIMVDAANPGVGQLYDAGFPIPDYSGGELMLSDVALGKPGVNGGWTRHDVTLALLPTSQFPQSEFDVYYEIYNLPADSRYDTEIAVERLDGAARRRGEQDDIHVRFSGTAHARSDGSVPELRRVAAPFDRGRYRLTVTVTDERTGRSVSRSRLFQVRGWEPGTTLVPAHPWWTAARAGPSG